MKNRILLIILFGTWFVCHAQQPQFENLDTYIEQSMKAWEVPGVAVAIVKDGENVMAKGYGLREIGKEYLVDAQTVFGIGSVSKSFTVASLGVLVDEGKIQWDDQVTDHLPSFSLYDSYVTRHMTIRDLLTHRSGLAGWAADHLWQGSKFDRDEILYRIRYQKPAGEFRIHFGYSNVMYVLAGQIISAIEGKSWDDFVNERIFSPLGMTSSTTSIGNLKDRKNIVTPHLKVDGNVLKLPWYNCDNMAPAGGVNSNVLDMSRWLKLHLNEGAIGDRQLLSKDVISEMQNPQMIIPKEWFGAGTPIESHIVAYGLGWWIFEYGSHKIIQHSGEIDGMRSMVTMIPEEQLGIVVLSNLASHFLVDVITYRILDEYLGLQKQDWNAKLLARQKIDLEQKNQSKNKLFDNRIKGTKTSLPSEAYVGTYFDELSGEAIIKKEGDHLVFQYNDKYIADLKHWHFDTFLTRWRDPYVKLWAGDYITFSLDETGNIASLRTKFDYEVVFDRVMESK